MSSETMTSAPPQTLPDHGLLRIYAFIRMSVAYTVLHLTTFGHVIFAPLQYPASFWTPSSFALLLPGLPDIPYIQWVNIIALVSLTLLFFGVKTRITGPVAFVFACMANIIGFSYGRLNHNTNTALLILFIFSFSDWGACWSIDAWLQKKRGQITQLLPAVFPLWPILITLAVFSFPYFTTALFKIIKGNFVAHGYIAALIKHKQFLWDIHGHVPDIIRNLQNFLMAHDGITDVLAWLTLVIELFFFVSLFSKQSRVVVLSLAIILHSSITLTTKVYFLEHIMILFTLLIASLLILWREDKPFFQKHFPQAPLANAEPNPALWQFSVLTYALTVLVLFLMPHLNLPEIPSQTWQQLAILHNGFWLFPTYTYLFDYHNDLIMSAVFWLVAAIVLTVYKLKFAKYLYDLACPKTQTEARERFLIYDGDCGFCTHWVNTMQSRNASPQITFQQGQQSSLLLKEACLNELDYLHYAIYIEKTAGKITEIWRGAGAINAVLRNLPDKKNAPLRLLGALYTIDVIKQCQDLGYYWVANNRHKLMPGACALPEVK